MSLKPTSRGLAEMGRFSRAKDWLRYVLAELRYLMQSRPYYRGAATGAAVAVAALGVLLLIYPRPTSQHPTGASLPTPLAHQTSNQPTVSSHPDLARKAAAPGQVPVNAWTPPVSAAAW